MSVVHDIAEQAKERGSGRTTVTTRCGQQHHRNSAARLPDDLTAWPSLVTCPECKR